MFPKDQSKFGDSDQICVYKILMAVMHSVKRWSLVATDSVEECSTVVLDVLFKGYDYN